MIDHVINRGNNCRAKPTTCSTRWRFTRGLAKTSAARQRRWHAKVHRPFAERVAAALQRSIATGLPYGSADWVAQSSEKLDLPLAIRPRGRPRKSAETETGR
jgi:hypothetical protein